MKFLILNYQRHTTAIWSDLIQHLPEDQSIPNHWEGYCEDYPFFMTPSMSQIDGIFEGMFNIIIISHRWNHKGGKHKTYQKLCFISNLTPQHL